MAPRDRRRLPDLCGIALLQMMPLADQLRAGQMNRRWTSLLRAANRRVCSLTISSGKRKVKKSDFKFLKDDINDLALGGSSRSMQMLTNEDGKPQYPIIGRLTQWNCLMMQFPSKKKKNVKPVNKANVFSVVQIVNAFSAITKLTFATRQLTDYEHLVKMLEENSHWCSQLTSFTLIDYYKGWHSDESYLAFDLNDRLFAAINTAMPALQKLSIEWRNGLKMVDDLPVIAQLKVLSAQCFNENFNALASSLERYAGDALDLQVILNSNTHGKIHQLGEDARDRILCYSKGCVSYIEDDLLDICNSFRSLVTFGIWSDEYFLAQHFTALAKLTQLVHLDHQIVFSHYNHPDIYTRPKTILPSVRAFDLNLSITDHSQVSWLNLSSTLPNLEVIHLKNFSCGICKVDFWDFKEYDGQKLDTALKCLRIVLPQLHSGLPLSRIILDLPNYRTAEDVMTENNE